MESMDSHFHRSIRMEIVCYSLSYHGTSFQYSLIQLYLSFVEIRNPYLNLGWMRYVIMHRHKYFCYYLFNIKKRDLPKRTGPLTNYIRVFYSSTAACAAANRCWLSTSYRVIVNYWRLFDDTFCTFLHAHGNNKRVFTAEKSLSMSYFQFLVLQ